jgi:predicted nucleic acid-binding protein
VIFIDTNVFYNTFFDTKFSDSARRFIEQNHKLVASSTVIHELILVSVRGQFGESIERRCSAGSGLMAHISVDKEGIAAFCRKHHIRATGAFRVRATGRFHPR